MKAFCLKFTVLYCFTENMFQFPPRLKVQCLKPNQWARMPNQDLQLHALKLSDIRGWSLLCEECVSMIALHIPEEDRCMDIYELIEHEKLLR